MGYNEYEGKVLTMTYRGQVKNGVVVLEDGKSLVEGTAVRIEPIDSEVPAKPCGPSALFHAGEHAKPTGFTDLGRNHDHYLYGHPKAD